jgi:hypothetical protein
MGTDGGGELEVLFATDASSGRWIWPEWGAVVEMDGWGGR